jgi:hypothetical protein
MVSFTKRLSLSEILWEKAREQNAPYFSPLLQSCLQVPSMREKEGQ